MYLRKYIKNISQSSVFNSCNVFVFCFVSLGNLVIKNVHHRDKGTYICLADNGIGNKVQKVFQIEVLGINNLNIISLVF